MTLPMNLRVWTFDCDLYAWCLSRFTIHAFVLLVVFLLTGSADSPPVDKSIYTLFNATPDHQLRPLSSEAYDGFTDARTLDAGRFQVEGQFVNYYFNSAAISHTSVSPFNNFFLELVCYRTFPFFQRRIRFVTTDHGRIIGQC